MTLFADATITALLTGGKYSYQTDTQGIGISPQSTPDAYDAARLLKPTALIRSRSEIPDRQITDEVTQDESAIEVIEIYFYDHRYTDWVSIEAAVARAYVLMNSKIVNGRHCHWQGDVRGREEALNDAARIRSAFQLTFVNSP